MEEQARVVAAPQLERRGLLGVQRSVHERPLRLTVASDVTSRSDPWQRFEQRRKDALMSETPKPPPELQLQIQLDDDTANGVYANMALVNHSETEFTLDFVFVQPQQPKASVRARVITSPKHLKRLIGALQDNLSKYEKRFGVVEVMSTDLPIH
jgi:hypothetical protein